MQYLKSRSTSAAWVVAVFIALQILDGLFKRSLANAGQLPFWAYDAALFVLLPAGALWHLARGKGERERYGLVAVTREWRIVELCAIAVLLSIILWAAYRGSSGLFSAVLPKISLGGWSFNWQSLLPPPGLPRTLLVIYLALTAGFAEELFYRAYLFEALKRNAPCFVLVSSLLFALAHWEQGLARMLASGVVGLIAAAAYRRAPVLWPLALAHAVVDLVSFW
jgi:membrane protease YdiL (CAAX protease family)